ncbi:MAG TPA: xanthine dehydrogenase family protein subunit M [Pyrinomonadaceae bacterium]|jgi:CO/xanthine dehydrogenase FAD-binding subunit
MRAYLPDYELVVPKDLSEALALLAYEPGLWRPFAGGTDLMVLFEAGLLRHQKFFSIRHLPELRGIEATPDYLKIGALTTYTEIQGHEILRSEFPMLCRAASETGGWAIQNRGTLGGNIANASPAGDSPPALLAYDAELELISAQGSRRIPYQGFHTGYKEMQLRSDELIKSIHLPRASGPRRHYYRKVGTRKAQAISKVCFAGLAHLDQELIKEIRIVLGSVAPVVIRCAETEALLRGQRVGTPLIESAKKTLATEIAPIDDVRSTADYRLRVSANLLEEFLLSLR